MFAKLLGTVLLFLIFLPYVITSMFGNLGSLGAEGSVSLVLHTWEKELAGSGIYVENHTVAGREQIPLETYLIDKLARTINTEYHLETLKAQAVLLRTALIRELWEEGMGIYISDSDYGRGNLNENIVHAVVTTRGVILEYDGKPAKVAYFAVSNGRTRDGSTSFEGLPYFSAVDCNRDFLAENFTSQKVMNKNDFVASVENATGVSFNSDINIDDLTIIRDKSGHILDIVFPASGEPVTLSGEECRFIWGLASSSFSIDETRNRIVFSVRGVGHGFGLSQFAANEMAKSDKDFISILEYFFSGLMLTKFE